MHPEEYLDLVNERDEVIGRKLRSEIYAEGLNNFRVINAFLVNSKGRFWIPRRTAHKAIFPLALDFSAAGHVESGDTYDHTFAKEVGEELNIDVSKVSWRKLGQLKPGELGERPKQFMGVYEIQSDETPNYNPDDFIEHFWLAPQEVIDRIEAGDKTKGDLPVLLKHFYLHGN
ncbi:MAG: NUDIX domain-containing protein [Candidatus Pacebacteria bacterium]|nr:NUDIX domain-containing protein [Candidatus Paceibacterota bacterium]